MKIKISNVEVQSLLSGKVENYPKYASQIINLANQNAQGTRSRVVGQMSDLVQEFDGNSVVEWERWYRDRYPESIEMATDKIFAMVENLKETIAVIDRDMVQRWVEELVVVKSFVGLRFQEAILSKVATLKGESYRLATPDDESKGIDGYIGEFPVSIKPQSYNTKRGLQEEITVAMIFYSKSKSGIDVEFDF